jgi:NhaP-type Na+/H+ or K+/H+ antiporter
MGFTAWSALIGGLLLLMSLASGWIHRLPVTSFSLYLLAGIIAGPWVLDLVDVDFAEHALSTARLTEMALVISLFLTGLKLRVGFHGAMWRTAARLALPAMVLTVLGLCAVAHWMFGLPWPLALLLGAIAAPTDPVLASMVAVDDARDKDALRLALSGEAGLNDGTALPFLVLALLMMHGPVSSADVGSWAWRDFAWSLLGGLGIGFALGRATGLLGVRLKATSKDTTPSDFLALGLMALAYAAAQAMSASSFLAAFAAGLGLRHAELRVVAQHPHPRLGQAGEPLEHPPAEMLVNPNRVGPDDISHPATSAGLVVSDALSFGTTLERLMAAALVLLLGAAFARYWHMAGMALALLLFVVVRPLSVYLSTIGSGIPLRRRLLIGWLGVRGIGSLNYLAFAMTCGLDGDDAALVSHFAITIVVLSIIVHGISTPPLLAWRQRRIERTGRNRRRPPDH